MFFIKENETLYLDNWNYNAFLIMEELRRIIDNHGGRYKAQTPGNVVKRSLLDAIRKNKEDAERIRARIESGDIHGGKLPAAYLEKLATETAELEAMPNDPRPVSGGSYLSFVLDETFYYIQLDENPFFEFYFSKTPLKNGKRSRDAVSQELKKDFLWDCFFSTTKPATDEDRREAAEMIFNQIVAAKNSTSRRDSTRRRVSNTYNGGYHYEIVYAPERMETVNF